MSMAASPDPVGRGSGATKLLQGTTLESCGSPFDHAAWRQRMQQADIADELFLPLECGEWHERGRGAKFRVPRDMKRRARTRVTGVRFLAADPERKNLEPERAVQTDFHRLVTSLMRIREGDPAGRAFAPSGELLRTSRRGDVPRQRFGLARADRELDERDVARRTYRHVRRSIGRAGFVVDEPTERFDPGTGLEGLRSWTDRLRLRKRRPRWPWLLLLLLPLLLWVPRCEPAAEFFGAPVETDAFVLLIDRSGSMQEHFAALRTEALRVLDQLARAGGCSVDVIAYDSDAESCLGGIRPLTDATRAEIETFLNELASGGGTNLKSGMDLAAKHTAALGEPTTLVILTDAEDSSIAGMIQGREALIAGFDEVDTRAHALTPEHFVPTDPSAPRAPAQPKTDSERKLAELAEILGGRFGPTAR